MDSKDSEDYSAGLEIMRFAPPGPVSHDFYIDCTRPNAAKVAGLMGPIGSAKTITCLARHVPFALHNIPLNPKTNSIDSRCLVLRKDYRVMDETVILSFKTLMDSWEQVNKVRWRNEHPKSAKIQFDIHDPQGNFLYHLNLEWLFLAIGDKPTPDMVFRGFEYSCLFANEFDIPSNFFEFGMTRMGRYPSLPKHLKSKQRALAWTDFNAPNRDDDVAQDFIFNIRDGYKLWRQPGGMEKGAENRQNLPASYYEDNEKFLKNPNMIARYIHNKIGHREDQEAVHPGYNENFHAVPLTPLADKPLQFGCDPGLSAAIVIMQEDSFGHVNFLAEFFRERISVVDFANQFVKFYQANFASYFAGRATIDPAGASGVAAARDMESWMIQFNRISQTIGLNFVPLHTNEFSVRKSAMDNALHANIGGGDPVFRVNADGCPMLRQGLAGGYHFKALRHGQGQFAEIPDKNNYSHVVEAAQYALVAAGYQKPQGEFAMDNKGFAFSAWRRNNDGRRRRGMRI